MEVLRLASPENNPPPPIPAKKRKLDKFRGGYDYPPVNFPAIVSCANAIWIDEQHSVKDSFKKLLNDVYRAEATTVDFVNQKEEAVKEINSWAEKSTNGRINNIVNPEEIDKNTPLVLTNAIYFKAEWSGGDHFGKSSSTKDFHLIDGINKVSVPFMEKWRTRFRYGKFDGFNVIELPYETGRPYCKRDEGPSFSMYIFLPHKVDGLSEMMSKFRGSSSNSKPSEALSQTLGVLEYVQMKKVVIPKWKFCNRLEPKDTMKKLGLKLPFKTNRGEFTEMCTSER
ncbi:At1g47710 [Linum perenne]